MHKGRAMTEDRTVPATLVARGFLDLANEREAEGQGLREPKPLHLIKWSYLAHGWAYPEIGRPLIGEPVEAWQFGPVYPELYHLIKRKDGERVDFVPRGAVEQLHHEEHGEYIQLNDTEKKLIEDVYDSYGELTGGQLIQLTHEKGGPWDKTKASDPEINQSLIREHYFQLAHQN